METAAYVIGIVVVVLGLLSAAFFSVGHRDLGLWTTCLAVVLAIIGGFCWYQSILWKRDETSSNRTGSGVLEPKGLPNQTEIDQPTPHLQAELVINSVTDGAIPFHVRITNIGDLDVTDLNIHQNASVLRSTGRPSPMLPLSKVLPKRGHVSMQGVDPAGLAKLRQFYATLTYKCSIKGEVNDFLASYRFVLPAGTLTPQQVIDPRYVIETAGDVLAAEGLRDEAKTSISDWFATEPVGTVSFWATERTKTGEANYIKFENDTRAFSYDPQVRKVWLSSKPVSESLMMSFEPKDRHFIVFSWDESGPSSLFVDGKNKTR
jgi:hypothetical protein